MNERGGNLKAGGGSAGAGAHANATEANATEARYGIVAGRFNAPITEALLAGTMGGLAAHGVGEERVECVWVPGAFEIPFACKKLMARGEFAAIIALGAVIRGETPHFDFVAGECARGVMRLNLRGEVPIIFGVLTTDTAEQARQRADVKRGNKGAGFAEAAVEMVRVVEMVGRGG